MITVLTSSIDACLALFWTGYGCECGPGYKWNSAVCVATSVDSRLDFLGKFTQYSSLIGCRIQICNRHNTILSSLISVIMLFIADDGELKYTKIQLSEEDFSQFTISFWIKLFKPEHNNTILSYRMTEGINQSSRAPYLLLLLLL